MPFARFLCLWLVLGASGCRISGAREVHLPTEGPTFRVDCEYEFNNCARYAKEHCPNERYEEITRKNCPRCGRQVPAQPQANAPVQVTTYHGTLFYRCR